MERNEEYYTEDLFKFKENYPNRLAEYYHTYAINRPLEIEYLDEERLHLKSVLDYLNKDDSDETILDPWEIDIIREAIEAIGRTDLKKRTEEKYRYISDLYEYLNDKLELSCSESNQVEKTEEVKKSLQEREKDNAYRAYDYHYNLRDFFNETKYTRETLMELSPSDRLKVLYGYERINDTKSGDSINLEGKRETTEKNRLATKIFDFIHNSEYEKLLVEQNKLNLVNDLSLALAHYQVMRELPEESIKIEHPIKQTMKLDDFKRFLQGLRDDCKLNNATIIKIIPHFFLKNQFTKEKYTESTIKGYLHKKPN